MVTFQELKNQLLANPEVRHYYELFILESKPWYQCEFDTLNHRYIREYTVYGKVYK